MLSGVVDCLRALFNPKDLERDKAEDDRLYMSGCELWYKFAPNKIFSAS